MLKCKQGVQQLIASLFVCTAGISVLFFLSCTSTRFSYTSGAVLPPGCLFF